MVLFAKKKKKCGEAITNLMLKNSVTYFVLSFAFRGHLFSALGIMSVGLEALACGVKQSGSLILPSFLTSIYNLLSQFTGH